MKDNYQFASAAIIRAGLCILAVIFLLGKTTKTFGQCGANANGPYSMCANTVTIQLTGYSQGTNPVFQWSTNGDGTFNDVTVYNPYYTPGTNDIAYGSVQITLTISCDDGPSASDDATITIITLPNVYTMTPSSGTYCNSNGNIDIGLVNSDNGVNYYLYNLTLNYQANSANGNGSNIDFGNPYNAGVYDAIAQDQTSGCTSVMNGSITINASPINPNVEGIHQTLCPNQPVELFASASGNMAQFNGSGQYFSVYDNPVIDFGTSDFTVEAWINLNGSQNDYTGIVSKGDNGSPMTGYQLTIIGNNLSAQLGDGTNTFSLTGITSLNDGNWHYVALIVNHTTDNANLYVDGSGTPDATTSITGIGSITNTDEEYIGADQSLSNFLNGNMDEVRIWDVARDAYISSAWNTQVLTNAMGLVSYYKLDDCCNNGASDATINNLYANNINNSIDFTQSTAPILYDNTCSYSWSTNATTSSIYVSQPNCYNVIISNGIGCTTQSNNCVNGYNLPFSINPTADSLCVGEQVSFGINGNTNDVIGGTWDFGDGSPTVSFQNNNKENA